MKLLLVHAHYEPKSFTAAMRDQAVATLGSNGYVVMLSDLYAMGFDPVAKKSDFGSPRQPEYIRYALEQRHGWQTGTIASDIRTEVEKLRQADLLILNFPVFWFSVPAIMKGWIDRVFLSGLTYGGRRFYDRGGLVGKKALVAATLGSRDDMFGADAVHGQFEAMFRHLLRGTLGYVGLSVLPPFMAWHVPYLTDDERKGILRAYHDYLLQVETLVPLSVPSLADFDDQMRRKSWSVAAQQQTVA